MSPSRNPTIAFALYLGFITHAHACGGALVAEATQVMEGMSPHVQMFLFANVGCQGSGSTAQIVQCACRSLEPCQIAAGVNAYAKSKRLNADIKMSCQ